MADEPFDFRELLDKPLSDFPDRPNLPGGKTFYGKLVGISAGFSKVKATPLFHFDGRITDPGADVPKVDLDKIVAAGFNLADYSFGADFYLVPGGMLFLRRFLVSLGFSQNVTFREALQLADSGEPGQASQDLIRGMDVIIRTPPADDQGRVYLNNVGSDGMIAGTAKR